LSLFFSAQIEDSWRLKQKKRKKKKKFLPRFERFKTPAYHMIATVKKKQTERRGGGRHKN
jgi:hypothetical protein